MPDLLQFLTMERCPHCNVDNPSLNARYTFQTNNVIGGQTRFWTVYSCARCGGAVMAFAMQERGEVQRIYPSAEVVDDALPSPAKEYLTQAIQSLAAPAGSVMLAASAVDAMLKAKGYTNGNLYPRINEAAEDHLITQDMAQWAHEVRLDANDPRHADTSNPLPSQQDATRSIDFVQALGQLLFVLPTRVRRGRGETSEEQTEGSD